MNKTAILPPIRPQEEVNPTTPADYKGEDGLLVCGVCGRRKQVHIIKPELGIDCIVPAACDCTVKADEERKRWKEREEQLKNREWLRVSSLMSANLTYATFEVYEHRQENEKAYRVARNYVDKFVEMKEHNQGLLFYGPVGTGKSFTSACIANALLEKGTTVIMTSFVKLLQEIQNSKEREEKYMTMLDNASLLIIDDLGAERNTSYALEKVYNIIDSRVRIAKPMILTTNMTIEQMRKSDSIEYQRIYDRIFEVCYPVLIPGTSMRIKKAKQRFDEMKELIGD